MVDIQSKEVIDKISDELKIQPSMQIPRELAKQIQLVYGVNPKRFVNIVRGGTLTSTGASSLFVASSERDTFLTSATLSYMADATADSIFYKINITPEGKALDEVIFLAKITTTAASDSITLSFNPPIKLERGSDVTFSHAFTVGVSVMGASVTAFETDPE